MACVFISVFFFLFHLIFLCSAEEQSKRSPDCQHFNCGKLNEMKFPFFSTEMKPHCGLFKMNCSSPNPTIQLVEEGRWYKVESIAQANTVIITDPLLQESLNAKECDALLNFSLPKSPSISIESLIYLYKCNHRISISGLDGFHRSTCRNYEIYYSKSNDSSETLSQNCTKFQLPGVGKLTDNGLFPYLNPTFLVHLKIPPRCYRCFYNGSRCKINNEKFDCVDKFILGKQASSDENKEGHKGIRLKLGLGIGASLLMLMILFTLLIHHRYRRRYSSNFLSRNTSPDQYSKSDVEGASVYFGVPIFSYKELEEATNGFSSDNLLGDGGFGTVFYGKLRDGREVAVKRLREHNYRRLEQFMNEIEILTRLRHKNLVSLYGSTSRRSCELLLVYDFIPNGTVADHLHGDLAKPGSLPWPVRISIAIETASALTYLHASDIIHRDVKTNNILLDQNFCVKVGDFGISRSFPSDVTHVSTAPQGTPGYVDPEYHQCYQLTSKSDVYSFGVVLVELISSMPAVDISRERNEINLANLAVNKIQKQEFTELIDSNLGYESVEEVKNMTILVAELAFRCLQQDKEMRPTMEEVLQELMKIQNGEYKLQNREENHYKNEVAKGAQESSSAPDFGEVALSKSGKPPASPISVTEQWASRSTAPDTSE